jgi:hypothetical protein
MQVMLDTSNYEDRDPAMLRALSTFLTAVAALYEPSKDEPAIPVNDVVVIRSKVEAAKFFGPEESLPADAFERGEKSPPPMIPPPPAVFIATAVPAADATVIPAATALVSSTATNAPLSANVLPFIPPPPGPPAAAEFDKHGVAYDANLHSSTRSQTIDGRWKARRNRGGSQVPAGTTSPPLMPPPQHTLKIQGVPVPPGQEAAAIAAYAGPQTIPPPPAAIVPQSDDDAELEADDTAPAAMDFPTFITKITAGMNAGTVTQARITEVMAQFKLDSLFSLNTKAELVGDVAAAFGFA